MKYSGLIVVVFAASMLTGCMSVPKPQLPSVELPSMELPKVGNPLAAFRRAEEPTDFAPSPESVLQANERNELADAAPQAQVAQDTWPVPARTQPHESLDLAEEKPSRLSFLSRFWR